MIRIVMGYLAFSVLVILNTARAQGVPVKQYLLTAKSDAVLQSRKAGGEFSYGKYAGLPLIRDMEIRVRNEAFDFARHRYTLRVEPRGFGEGRASRLYNENQLQHSEQRNRVLLNRALLHRYLMAVDLLMRQSTQGLYADMIVVAEDKIKVLDMQKGATDFNLSTLIEAEVDLTKVKSLFLDSKKEIDVLEQRIGRDLSSERFSGFDTTGLVDVEAIIAEVEKSSYVVDSNHVYLAYLDLGLSLAEKRYKLEQAEGKQFLSYLSFSYDVGERADEIERRRDGKDFDLSRAYILEAGFRIPGLTTGSQDLNRRKSEFLSEREDVEQSRTELRETMQKDIQDIHSLVLQYRYMKARENEVDAEASLKKYMQMSGVDPLILLSIKSGSLKNSLKLAELKFGIIMNYIKVMDATGRLSKKPLRNFLSSQFEEMDPG